MAPLAVMHGNHVQDGVYLRTVHTHVENILGKMGVENRTIAAEIISQANGA